MGKRKVIIKQSIDQRIAEISWFVESQGMTATAENFSDSAYDFFEKLSDESDNLFNLPRAAKGQAWLQMCSIQKKIHSCSVRK